MTKIENKKWLDIIGEKIEIFDKKNINPELQFELEFIKYRLNNIKTSTNIKDINTNKTYELRKFWFFIQNSDFNSLYTPLVSENEIKEISKLKFSEFNEYAKKLNTSKEKLYLEQNKSYI